MLEELRLAPLFLRCAGLFGKDNKELCEAYDRDNKYSM